MRHKNEDIPHPRFTEWWDEDVYYSANPFEKGSPAFWAWEGWQAALNYDMPKEENKK
jgi:hypothetical protein